MATNKGKDSDVKIKVKDIGQTDIGRVNDKAGKDISSVKSDGKCSIGIDEKENAVVQCKELDELFLDGVTQEFEEFKEYNEEVEIGYVKSGKIADICDYDSEMADDE